MPDQANKLLRALLLAGCASAAAMLATPTLAQSAAKTTDEMERAQRDADKVFKMILINSDAPRKKRAPETVAGAGTPAAVPARAVPVAAASNSPESIAAAAAVAAARGAEPARVAAAPAAAVAAAPESRVAIAPQVAQPAPQSAAAVLAPAAPASSPAAEEEDDDESPLVPRSQVRPSFRSALMQELRQGTVRVRFEVQPDGSVARAEVVSTTNRGLNSAALAAVGQWKFEPLKKPRQAQVELGFNIEN